MADSSLDVSHPLHRLLHNACFSRSRPTQALARLIPFACRRFRSEQRHLGRWNLLIISEHIFTPCTKSTNCPLMAGTIAPSESSAAVNMSHQDPEETASALHDFARIV